MLKSLIILILFVPSLAFAQTTITGKVITEANNQPIPDASVFLSNASVGSRTIDNGTFNLHNVKNGQYDLVVSCVGYEPHYQTVFIDGKDLSLPAIKLAVKVNMLKEVRIGYDANRARYLQQFLKEFLGQTANAQQCKILNPDIIDLNYSKRTGDLKASTDDFLIIENKALGYTIKYILQAFIHNSRNGSLYYAGSSVFEPMKGGSAKLKRWDKKRTEVYYGSSMHFLRTCLANQLEEQKFEVLKIIRKKSTVNPADTLIKKSKPLTISLRDSPFDILVNKPLVINDFIKLTEKSGIYAFGFSDRLRITYNSKEAQTSVITFVEEYSLFDMNGIVLNPQSNTMEGYWGTQRMAELLPVDYELPKSAKN